MNEPTKNTANRIELKERIVAKAEAAFSAHGIKTVTMDEIATSLGISKRTLYEIFADKESLLQECILRDQATATAYTRQLAQQADNVLEILLGIFMRSIERYHTVNRRFFDDIKKYPKAFQLIVRQRQQHSDEALRFFHQGVEQGIFRSDINFDIVNQLVEEQLNFLMDSDICKTYTFLEVYESIMFTWLRGISTPKGAQLLEDFIHSYRHKTHINLNEE